MDGSNVRTRVWKHTGRRTQNVKSKRIIDHLPVVMTFYMNLMKALLVKRPNIDRDNVVRCMMFGYKRHTFFRAVDRHCCALQDEWTNSDVIHSPTGQYGVLRKAMDNATIEVVPKKNTLM